jgi:tetratricopeptide (TPR) repeat protein
MLFYLKRPLAQLFFVAAMIVASATVAISATDAPATEPTATNASTREEGGNAPMSADAAYQATFHWLSLGKQREMEQVLDEAVQVYDRDPRLLFFHAACTRSRFMWQDARPLFQRVVDVAPSGDPYGQAAQLILKLDVPVERLRYEDIVHNFKSLTSLVDRHADDPLLLWMAGVECRTYKVNALGCHYYDLLLKQLQVGPSLVHQTYANLLDEIGRPAEALPHRQMALKLEPAAWSIDGLGITLSNLRRFDEADRAYAQSTKLQPRHLQYWENWICSKRERGDWPGMIELSRKALSFNPGEERLYNAWGDAERQLGHPEQALEAYRHSIECTPIYTHGYDQSAEVLTELGRTSEATAMHAKAEALRALRPEGRALRAVEQASTRPAIAPASAPAGRPWFPGRG